ncbi:PEP-CTERM sorting domain-containing protein [Duganella sp. FT94W]|uniref:PEP-CTERM sorting domain-containing protein n=1 Tax=Duganella lactea TaxID=2692173 RepID=A0ABW9V8I2_9BURK|nr:PEP-CTERM sorting domain-containing protein [Duganella lactea]MYM35062.1 PEP-CTERM sorting domain-containing protein [Duganella lactea]
MKNVIRFGAVVIAMALSTIANATTFEFSYKFNSGVTVTGTFDGTANGNLVTGLSNASLSLNGASLGNNLYIYVMNGFVPSWNVGNAVASFDGYANNFIFADGGRLSSHNYFFSTKTDGFLSPVSYSASLSTLDTYQYDSGPAGAIQGGWHLAAVPEPETYAMLLAGLGLVGAIARRKRLAA